METLAELVGPVRSTPDFEAPCTLSEFNNEIWEPNFQFLVTLPLRSKTTHTATIVCVHLDVGTYIYIYMFKTTSCGPVCDAQLHENISETLERPRTGIQSGSEHF